MSRLGSFTGTVRSCGRWFTPRLRHLSDVAAWCKSWIWRVSVWNCRRPLNAAHCSVGTSDYLMKYGRFASYPEAAGWSSHFGGKPDRVNIKRWAANRRDNDGYSELLRWRPCWPALTWSLRVDPEEKHQKSLNFTSAGTFYRNQANKNHCLYKTKILNQWRETHSTGKLCQTECDGRGKFLVLCSPKAP